MFDPSGDTGAAVGQLFFACSRSGSAAMTGIAERRVVACVSGGLRMEWGMRRKPRIRRQDKSREARLGRSGRESLQINDLHTVTAMCREGPRCAVLVNLLVFQLIPHLAGFR